MMFCRTTATLGALSLGLMTTVLPAAMAPANGAMTRLTGKLYGLIVSANPILSVYAFNLSRPDN